MALIQSLRAQLGFATHEQVVDVAANVLRNSRWQVEQEPVVGTMRPDIIARDPDGKTYVFEVKAGKQNAFLGAVAQVEGYRDRLAEGGKTAQGVLVLAGDAPSELDDVARSAGVALVRATSGSPTDIEESLSRTFATVGRDRSDGLEFKPTHLQAS
jgi:RecB family endonuclease NucS